MEGDLPYIVMQYVAGTGLRTWAASVARSTRDGRTQIVEMIEQVARALHVAHLQGIVHRDIKPGNIRVTPEGRPVLLDFGLASLVEGGENQTASQDVMGTPAYMAPEQIDPRGREPTPRTDVFALCVTLFELLTDRRPFEGSTLESTYKSILGGVMPDPIRLNPAVDTDLKAILGRGLERSPGRRFVSARALADDLRRYLEHRPIHAKPAGPILKLRRWYTRRPALAAALTMVVVSLAGGLVSSLVFLGQVTEQRNRVHHKAQEYGHLAAGRSLDQLLSEVDASFWRVDPGRAKVVEDWLRRARDLTAKLPVYCETRARMRKQSTPLDPALSAEAGALLVPLEELKFRREQLARLEGSGVLTDPAWAEVREILDVSIDEIHATLAGSESRTFESEADAWHFEQLDTLIKRLTAFEAETGESVGIPAVEALMAAIGSVDEQTLVAYEEPWRMALEQVSRDARFDGLDLAPIRGLIPLGADPDSGLQEFAVWGTGSIPSRDSSGQLLFEDESAAVLVLLVGGPAEVGASPDDDMALLAEGEGQRHINFYPFLIGKHEITQAQWLKVIGNNPSAYLPGHADLTTSVTLRNPVESVSWNDCRDFVLRLGMGLPSETQWEYACRAGVTTRFAWGHAVSQLEHRSNLGDESVTIPGYVPAPWNDGFTYHAPVGTFVANRFGLFDMHGNVAEWTCDRYRKIPLPLNDPSPSNGMDLSATGPSRCFRGGSWYTNPRYSRASSRNAMDPSGANQVVGLRLAMNLSR